MHGRWLVPVVSLIVAVAPSASRAAADIPDLATLRANAAAAVGTVPANEARTIAFTLDGLPGTRTLLRSGDDYLESTSYGPLQRARGTLAGRHWHQNENGETVLEEPDPGHAAKEAYETTIARVETPVAGYAVSSLNSKGFGSREYIDATTWRVVRRESITSSGTSVVTYDDFRTVAGYTTPFHWTIDDGHPENAGEYRVTEEHIGSVTAADLAIPPPRRALVEFPAGATSVALPARAARDVFVVRLTIGGRGCDFMLDTGASGIVIDDDVASALHLTAYGATSNGANAGRYVSRTVVASHVAVGDLSMHDVVMRTIPHLGAERSTDDFRIVGLLGFDFIDAVSLKLDYDAGTITATRADAFVPPSGAEAYPLDVRLGTGQPMIDVRVNGSLGERFVLDTGAYGSILIDDYFARRYPDAMVDEGHGEGRTRRYYGVGGSFSTQPYQLSSVELGAVRFKDFVAYRVTSASSYGGNIDGQVGSELLKYFTVFTDYARGKVYLQTNEFGRSASGQGAISPS
jgi:predicted aspartyl protease